MSFALCFVSVVARFRCTAYRITWGPSPTAPGFTCRTPRPPSRAERRSCCHERDAHIFKQTFLLHLLFLLFFCQFAWNFISVVLTVLSFMQMFFMFILHKVANPDWVVKRLFFFYTHTHPDTHTALIVSCVLGVCCKPASCSEWNLCEEGQRRRITNDYCCWLSSLLEHWILMWRPSVWLTWCFPVCFFPTWSNNSVNDWTSCARFQSQPEPSAFSLSGVCRRSSSVSE